MAEVLRGYPAGLVGRASLSSWRSRALICCLLFPAERASMRYLEASLDP